MATGRRLEDLPTGELREAKVACELLRLAESDAEALLRSARERRQQAEHHFDRLMLMHDGQIELPLEGS